MTITTTRPRGVQVFPIRNEEVSPFDRYAVLVRHNPGSVPEVRMVHTEGVSYLVTNDKPWCWTDHAPELKHWTPAELLALAIAEDAQPVDLADWVRTFGARLESNFHMTYVWATESD